MGEAKIFWRHGVTKNQTTGTTCLPNNYVKDGKFTPKKNGYYQFAIIFDVGDVMSAAGQILREKQ